MQSDIDAVYKERNQLVCALSKLLPSHLLRHDEKDETWDNDWKWIICIHGPAGTMTWHIHDSELPMFSHLPKVYGQVGDTMGVKCDGWDGHTSEEKYRRLSELPDRYLKRKLKLIGDYKI